MIDLSYLKSKTLRFFLQELGLKICPEMQPYGSKSVKFLRLREQDDTTYARRTKGKSVKQSLPHGNLLLSVSHLAENSSWASSGTLQSTVAQLWSSKVRDVVYSSNHPRRSMQGQQTGTKFSRANFKNPLGKRENPSGDLRLQNQEVDFIGFWSITGH